MSDETKTAMLAPDQNAYSVPGGQTYRADYTLVVHAMPADVASLIAVGFQVATATEVPPGVPLALDMGWAVMP